jgi:hypothetical protein
MTAWGPRLDGGLGIPELTGVRCAFGVASSGSNALIAMLEGEH